MTTFYICRHGETENNKNGLLSGWIDTPLTLEGETNAAASAAKLQGTQFDKIISSDLGRAFVTAYIISRKVGYAGEIARTRALREVNYGDLAGRPYSAYPQVTPAENTHFISPNGESLAQMQERAMTYIRTLGAQNPDKTILLVAHDGTINAVRASYTGQEMGIVDLHHNAHDFAARFTLQDGMVASFEEVRA